MPCLTSTEHGNTHSQKHSLPAGDLVTLAANNAALTGALTANREIRRKSRCKQRDTHRSSRCKQ